MREVRTLAPGEALMRAVAGMLPQGASTIEPSVNTVYVLVAVERDGAWRVTHFQATPAAFHGRPQAVEALTAEVQAEVDAEGP